MPNNTSRRLIHEWVSCPYPDEIHWTCNKCGAERIYHWSNGNLEGGECTWIHHATPPSPMQTDCMKCGHHDCADGHHGELLRCQTVGECSGMWYNLYENTETGDVICQDCWETWDPWSPKTTRSVDEILTRLKARGLNV